MVSGTERKSREWVGPGRRALVWNWGFPWDLPCDFPHYVVIVFSADFREVQYGFSVCRSFYPPGNFVQAQPVSSHNALTWINRNIRHLYYTLGLGL